MKPKRKKWLKLVLLGISAFVVVVVCFSQDYTPAGEKEEDTSSQSEQENPPPQAAGRLDHLVFITTSQGCKCTLERNRKAKEILDQILKDFPLLLVKRLDFVFQRDEAVSHLEKARVRLLPALLLYDSAGSFLDSITGFFTSATVKEKLEHHLGKKAKIPREADE